jgi:hypothetical protein
MINRRSALSAAPIMIAALALLAGCTKPDQVTLTVPPGGSMKHCSIERPLPSGGWFVHDCAMDRAELAF